MHFTKPCPDPNPQLPPGRPNPELAAGCFKISQVLWLNPSMFGRCTLRLHGVGSAPLHLGAPGASSSSPHLTHLVPAPALAQACPARRRPVSLNRQHPTQCHFCNLVKGCDCGRLARPPADLEQHLCVFAGASHSMDAGATHRMPYSLVWCSLRCVGPKMG